VSAEVTIRRARVPDAPAIVELVRPFAEANLMLPRPAASVYTHLRDFHVAERPDGTVVGCCALSLLGEDLAEVRTLAVHEAAQGTGAGKRLVAAALEEAVELGVPRVFALTRVPGFFEKLGFERTEMSSLPQKVWNDCIHCPLFPNCDEIALVREVG
jgi:amino-acid N-acetyltransferase